MKASHLLAANAIMAAVLILAAAKAADAQRTRPIVPLPPERPIQRVYITERVVVQNAAPPAEAKAEEPKPAEPPPAAPAPAPAEPPRKPYAVGETYVSLPGGCMKLIDAGVSYYNCGGEWYRQVGSQYKAVSQP